MSVTFLTNNDEARLQHNFSHNATATYDLSVAGDGSVKMYLFPHAGGYAAVVSGEGAMKNHELTLHAKGYKVTTETREYAEHLEKINKVYIERGVTTIGDYFMHHAFYLKEVVFEDSSQITYLGKYCFSCTQISGEYKFCKLLNGTTIQRSFYCCPKLEGITLGVDATTNRNFTLSEQAFFGCLNLRHFKVDDPLNTSITWGGGCFYYCPGLELMEFQPDKTNLTGLGLLMNPCTKAKVKYKTVNGNDNDIMRYSTIGGTSSLNSETTLCAWVNPTAIAAKDYTAYYAWMLCTAVAEEYAGKRHELMLYETDAQKQDEYLIDEVFPTSLDSKAVFWGKYGDVYRVHYYGSCWLFAYMHIWNVLHGTEQYATIEDFVKKLQETKITVDSELATAFASWDFKDDVMATGVYADDGYFDEGSTIYVTDLPTDLISTDEDTTEGETGTASWGVRKVLGWTGERLTGGKPTTNKDSTWADIKRQAIDSIFAGKPVIFECVGYLGSATDISNANSLLYYGGAHAVAAIGYDATTDMFKIIDSTWGFPSDEIPMEYWTTFEAMLEPSGESAVWVFSEFDSGATITSA